MPSKSDTKMPKPSPIKNGNSKINTASPGHALKSLFMDPLGLTAYRVAKDIGISPIAMSHILRGMRAITPSVAVRLGQYFEIEPEFWMTLQVHYDLSLEAAVPSKKKALVARCPALEGKAFVLKETKINGTRNWQVLMVRTAKR